MKEASEEEKQDAIHDLDPKALLLEIKRLRQMNLFLNSIIDTIPNMVFLKDAKNLNFVRINKAGENLTGFKQADFLGKSDYDFFPEEEADFFTEKDRKVLENKDVLEIKEEPLLTKDKQLRFLRTKKVALCDDSGTPAYLLGISEDITEHIKNKEKLAHKERQLKLVLSTSGLGTWMWNLQKDEVKWDSNMFRLFNTTAEDFKENYKSAIELIQIKDQKRVMAEVDKSLAGNKDFQTTFEIKETLEHPAKLIAARGFVNRDSKGKPKTMTGICWDITEEQRKQALEIKSELISMVSHELRTPIHTIKEGISVILEGLLGDISDEQKDVLQTTQRCIDRLTRLINNVLNFQKMEAGIEVLDLKPQDLNALISDLADIEGSAFRRKEVELKLKLTPSLPEAEIDSDKIIQVLTNLMHNALKFTSKGAVTVITKRLGSEKIEVSVQDTGIGLAQEDLETLFTVFGQTEAAKQIAPHGTGLGLAISKKIIEQHHGTISAKPVSPVGSIFTFTIPVAQSKGE